MTGYRNVMYIADQPSYRGCFIVKPYQACTTPAVPAAGRAAAAAAEPVRGPVTRRVRARVHCRHGTEEEPGALLDGRRGGGGVCAPLAAAAAEGASRRALRPKHVPRPDHVLRAPTSRQPRPADGAAHAGRARRPHSPPRTPSRRPLRVAPGARQDAELLWDPLPTSAEGVELHLSHRSATGYEGVRIWRSPNQRDESGACKVRYRAVAPMKSSKRDRSVLGYYDSKIEAAVAFAKYLQSPAAFEEWRRAKLRDLTKIVRSPSRYRLPSGREAPPKRLNAEVAEERQKERRPSAAQRPKERRLEEEEWPTKWRREQPAQA
eukprot:2393081-Prymnesium_polylepis.1